MAGLHADTLRNALYRHCPKYEKIISEYLNVPVEKIWPSRYKTKAF
jgi:Ner family transcriptional regulator